jgi:hypothetical protein
MWNMKCFVIPVIIAATGIVSKHLQKYLETIPGQHSVDSLQKTAILGTSHIIRKVLQAESWSLSGGVHHWLKRRSTRDERKPLTRNDDDDNNNNNNNNNNKVALQSSYGPWPRHTGILVILLRHSVGLPWTSDQFVAMATTYTGQHNTETHRQTSMPRAGFEPTIVVTKQPRSTP